MPPNREDLVIQRILIRHGFTLEMGHRLLVEMKAILDGFAQHTPQLPTAGSHTSAEQSQHDHSGR
jgi:glutamate decarboxylase